MIIRIKSIGPPQVAGGRYAPPMVVVSLNKTLQPIRSFSTIRPLCRGARGGEFWSSQGAGRPDGCVRRSCQRI